MVRSGGRYLLFYSGNEHRSAAYAVGYADCAGPAGPCTKHGGNPILASSGDRLGPGAPAPFHDTSGTLRLAYHYWNRSEEHPSELQSLMRISYAVFCLKKKKRNKNTN